MSYDLPKPIEFEVGDIVRPRVPVGPPISYRDLGAGQRNAVRYVVGSPVFRVREHRRNEVYVSGIDEPDSRLMFLSRDLVKIDMHGYGDPGVATSTKGWPVYPVGCLVRVRAEWGPAYSTDTRWCLVYSEHVANEVLANFAPADGTEPTMTLSIDHGRAQQVFRVSPFERVYFDDRKLRPWPIAERTSPSDGFVVVDKWKPIEPKMLSYKQPSYSQWPQRPSFSVDALRERAKAIGATLPLGVDEENAIDWSTGFDENYDDHRPRERKF